MFILFPAVLRVCLGRIPVETSYSERALFSHLVLVDVYLLFAVAAVLVFLYNFLEIHFLRLLASGFRGDPVTLVYNAASEVHRSVAAACRVINGRYSPTPWLPSSHLQTAFLSFFGRPPDFSYKRELFCTVDGGTIALDWLRNRDVGAVSAVVDEAGVAEDRTPILIVIPGLTSDSSAPYIKHIVFKMASGGWNVVVSNHRGLGGISVTSDTFYNAGWTEDLRKIVEYLHQRYSKAPLFLVGTSIGANILVKYLGEESDRIPISGAAAICCPWDLLICDRFINRRLVQKLYDRVLAIGLQGYAQLHEGILSRLVNWEGVQKSRSVRDFDNHATRILGKYETVDTYYRRNSGVNFIGGIAIPLLCISALDDPVCTKEAIPIDECRLNPNIVLALTQHGGHLAYFEGMTASSVWWVRAVDEFFGRLLSSPLLSQKAARQKPSNSISEPLMDEGPYLTVSQDGMVAPAPGDQAGCVVSNVPIQHAADVANNDESLSLDEQTVKAEDSQNLTRVPTVNPGTDTTRRTDRLLRYNRMSVWLLAYIAVVTTWPVVGSALTVFAKRRLKNGVLRELFRR
ncbi:hypothetical protein MLD38_023156 [Melastoma candidum]|uniref:Uncharacterized protein n=1 Tax=Melastoma candidum TaxID=119954 RepID=A0ACB9QPP0_9MYRT|nr:hypothetical protein MLD38_023156 [Melastoma candidum]